MMVRFKSANIKKQDKKISFPPSEGTKYSACAVYDIEGSTLSVHMLCINAATVRYNMLKNIRIEPYGHTYSWSTEVEEGRSYVLFPLSNAYLQGIVIGEENPLEAIKELFRILKDRLNAYEQGLTDKFSAAAKLIMENIYKITQDKFYYGLYVQTYNDGGRIIAYSHSTDKI